MNWEQILQLAQKEKQHKRPSHHEDSLQEACIRWFDYSYPNLKLLLFHATNEGKVTKTQAVRRKKMGVRPGVADLILLVPNNSSAYLAIELKTPQGKQSENQKKWQETAERNGGKYTIARTVDEFINIIQSYFNNKL